MLNIDFNDISLTRGDSAIITLSLNLKSGEPYQLQDGDECVLTVKTNEYAEEIVFQKQLVDDNFVIEPADTEYLDYGTYKYDVQLTTKNGNVYTVIAPSRFVVEKEVTFNV